MSWELGQEYREYVAPSIWVYIHDNENSTPREVALTLMEESLHGVEGSDFEGDKDYFESIPLEFLVDLISHGVDSMTNGAHAFCIGSGGWITVPVCSEEQMLEYYS